MLYSESRSFVVLVNGSCFLGFSILTYEVRSHLDVSRSLLCGECHAHRGNLGVNAHRNSSLAGKRGCCVCRLLLRTKLTSQHGSGRCGQLLAHTEPTATNYTCMVSLISLLGHLLRCHKLLILCAGTFRYSEHLLGHPVLGHDAGSGRSVAAPYVARAPAAMVLPPSRCVVVTCSHVRQSCY